MKIIVIGGTGIVGSGIVNLLTQEHEVIVVGKNRGVYQADLLKPESIRQLLQKTGPVDGVISTIGDGKMAPLHELQPTDFEYAINSKLIGNFNLYKEASGFINKGGFLIFTSGVASMRAVPEASTLGVACAAIEAFVRSAALENTRKLRINAVSPDFVKETMELFGMDSSYGISSADTALVYKTLMESEVSGTVADVREFVSKMAVGE